MNNSSPAYQTLGLTADEVLTTTALFAGAST